MKRLFIIFYFTSFVSCASKPIPVEENKIAKSQHEQKTYFSQAFLDIR